MTRFLHPSSGAPHLYLPPLVSEEFPRVLDDLLIRQPVVRLLLAQREHLPQCHAKGPHVAGRGELALWEWRGKPE